MDGLNENVGLVVLIVAIVLIAILCVIIWLLVEMRKKIAVQRLKFIGQFSADPDTRKMVANITVSNRSLNDITITELGLRNGKVNFDYTETYKKQSKLSRDARVVVGQRDAIRFSLSAEELVKVLIQNTNGKIVLKKISVYAMDSTGIAYIGRASDVKKLLSELAKNGIDYLPPAFDVQSVSTPASAPASAPAPASAARPAQPAEKPKASYGDAFSKKVEEVSAAKDKAPKA